MHASSEARADHQVERLVSDIAGVIRSAEPGKRAELKDLAEALLRDEFSSIAESSVSVAVPSREYGLNTLLPGILIIVLGLAFFLIFPLVGLTLAGMGAVLTIWGGLLSWLKK
jgi:hypothetical protein